MFRKCTPLYSQHSHLAFHRHYYTPGAYQRGMRRSMASSQQQTRSVSTPHKVASRLFNVNNMSCEIQVFCDTYYQWRFPSHKTSQSRAWKRQIRHIEPEVANDPVRGHRLQRRPSCTVNKTSRTGRHARNDTHKLHSIRPEQKKLQT